MGRKENRPPRPRFTVIRGNGSMRSARRIRFATDPSIENLPTRIYFTRGSSTPTGRSLATLRSYAEWLAARRSRRILVLGHANRRSWREAARALALARARAVRDLLVFLGARRDQIRRASAARLHSIGKNSTADVRRKHRYVELIAIPTGRVLAEMPIPPRQRAGGRAVGL